MHHFHRFSRGLLLALAIFASPVSAVDHHPTFSELAATVELIESVQQGGFVLYMRHGATDSAQPDQVPIDLDDCATQRPLTDAGRDEVRAVGVALRQAGIPFGEILSSPLCRAVETARIVFPAAEISVVAQLMYTAHLTSEEKLPIVATTRELISRPVAMGANRVLVAHAPNLADVMAYFPAVEGTVVVFRPRGDGEFDYLASIHPDHWPELLEALGAP